MWFIAGPGYLAGDKCKDGACLCKENVEGSACDACKTKTFGLSADNDKGCQGCGCNLDGTVDGAATCDSKGLCKCKSGFTGRTCDSCGAGFFSTQSGKVCSACGCSETGSKSSSCNTKGVCECKEGFTGDKCDTCATNFGTIGGKECVACNCDTKGVLKGSGACKASDGQCTCKKFSTGQDCAQCATGYSVLEASNPDGCSKAPGAPATPKTDGVTESSILLSWAKPLPDDYGPLIRYELFRAQTKIYSGLETKFLDTKLAIVAHSRTPCGRTLLRVRVISAFLCRRPRKNWCRRTLKRRS